MKKLSRALKTFAPRFAALELWMEAVFSEVADGVWR